MYTYEFIIHKPNVHMYKVGRNSFVDILSVKLHLIKLRIVVLVRSLVTVVVTDIIIFMIINFQLKELKDLRLTIVEK